MPSTVLVSMPFFDRTQPSIQLGLLAAVAREAGFEVRTLHANLDLAACLGTELYDRLADHRGRMVGEWLFSVAAFGAAAPDADSRFVDDFEADLGGLAPELERIRDEVVPAYLDTLIAAEAWAEVDVVGFSSTFQQNTASFALAKRLKARWPHLVTIFGGANFDGEMGKEYVRTIDCIDLAVIGEGDRAFPEVLAAISGGTDPGYVPGVASRNGPDVRATPPAPLLRALDASPDPDYGEYFERAERLGLMSGPRRRATWIPFESSRGCWWGEKHHCTFCGLNATTMAFRSKSPGRVADELARQVHRFGSFRFAAVDNILDHRFVGELLPLLAEAGTGYEVFYEVKANLSRADLRELATAGVRHLQPGLESLSTNVLRLMRKGVRAIQNVNLLRWARYYGVDIQWSILRGFPGETLEDYAEQASAVPALLHLQPPSAPSRIWLERFSPLFRDADDLGIRRRPERSYQFVYPEFVDLERAAYFFDHEFDDELPGSAFEPLEKQVSEWLLAWQAEPRPTLTYRSSPGYLQVYDARQVGEEGTYTFRHDVADLYLACVDRPTTAQAVSDRLGGRLSVGDVAEIFGELHEQRLMFLDGTWALALALPALPGR